VKAILVEENKQSSKRHRGFLCRFGKLQYDQIWVCQATPTWGGFFCAFGCNTLQNMLHVMFSTNRFGS